ncbi:MAG: hypothetical protein AB1744_12930, partial [Candidatus Zixiibacteriota bacterium]
MPLCPTVAADTPGTHKKPPFIQIVYPKPGQVVTATDSTFILGHVACDTGQKVASLIINGHPVEIHPDGGFLAYLPITPGPFTFFVEALIEKTTTPQISKYRRQRFASPSEIDRLPRRVVDSVTFDIPVPPLIPPPDSLAIVEPYQSPHGNLVLTTGDLLRAGFRGTPGCCAWFEIPGIADSIPMAEIQAASNLYWGEAVFGTKSDSPAIRNTGIYTGYYTVTDNDRIDTVHIVYHLAPPSIHDLIRRFLLDLYDSTSIPLKYYLDYPDSAHVVFIEPFTVTLNDSAYPFTVRFTDSVQIVRHGPGKGYLTIFQPEGVEVLAVGAEGEWYRVRLSDRLTGWVHQESVERLPKEVLPPRSYLTSVRTISNDERLIVRFPLS